MKIYQNTNHYQNIMLHNINLPQPNQKRLLCKTVLQHLQNRLADLAKRFCNACKTVLQKTGSEKKIVYLQKNIFIL